MKKPDRDGLDAAIDHVAARMVAVPDNPELVTRIVNALPDRSARLRWLIPRAAALGAIVLAAVLWTMPDSATAPPALPSSPLAALDSPPPLAAREPGILVETQPWEPEEPVEPVERVEPLEPVAAPDFERSLPAIAPAAALALGEIQTRELAPLAPIGIAPIEVPELKMTAETFSQKEE